MENNPKIYATGNENLSGNYNVSYYIVEKDDKFLDWLGKLLSEVLELEDGERKAKFIVENSPDNPNGIITPKKLSEMIDFHEHYDKNKERIDVFYGSRRVYLTLRKSKGMRKKFAEFVQKTKDWIRIDEVSSESVPKGTREISAG